MTLGTKLRTQRERAGLSREVVAVGAGISVSTLVRFESDLPPSPRVSVLEAIAAQLGTTAADLLAGPTMPEAVGT